MQTALPNTFVANSVITAKQITVADKNQVVKQQNQSAHQAPKTQSHPTLTISAYGQLGGTQAQVQTAQLAAQPQQLNQAAVTKLKAAMAKTPATFGKVEYKAAEGAANEAKADKKDKKDGNKRANANPFGGSSVVLAGLAKNGSNPFAVAEVRKDPRQS